MDQNHISNVKCPTHECDACKVEPIESDAKFIHDPDITPTTCRSKRFGTWPVRVFETCCGKAETKAEGANQQAPKGKDTNARSQGSFLDIFSSFQLESHEANGSVLLLNTLGHAAP